MMIKKSAITTGNLKKSTRKPNTVIDETQSKPKQKPGRPRKVFKPKSVKMINRVIDESRCANHIMELSHYDPGAFKQVIVLLNQHYVDAIFIQFDMDSVSIKSKDHTKTPAIPIAIDCNKLWEYDCKYV